MAKHGCRSTEGARACDRRGSPDPLAGHDQSPSEPDYPDIGDYAVIGDCRTAALVSRDGSLDWFCLPHFSGAAVFAALLDRRRGGRFLVRPAPPYRVERQYIGRTNVLETTFRTAHGVVRVTDLMPVWGEAEAASALRPQQEVLRVVEVIDGEVELEVLFEPRRDYGLTAIHLQQRGALGWACQNRNGIYLLHADLPLEADADAGRLRGRTRLSAGDKRYLSFVYEESGIAAIPPLGADAEERLAATLRWWDDWIGRCTYDGPYHQAVTRSALTLKLMTYAISGAVVAAPTTSLPERIGGPLNWDYRYCWLRDASLTLRAFLDLGWPLEADAFVRWLLHATRLTWPELQVCYDVYGETALDEVALEHVEGYRHSRPVRIGNAVDGQLQLDIYGAVVLAACDFIERGGGLNRAEARLLKDVGETVCKRWREPDNGIWEVRGARRQHTYSKLMCWVALDRLIRLDEEGILHVGAERFRRERAALRDSIEAHGFRRELGCYVGVFDTDELDASLLLMARCGYLDAADPRMVATWQRIRRDLDHDGITFRHSRGYDPTAAGEGGFGICSFWTVDYLARLGEIDEAVRRFERLLSCANVLGLYGEQIDVQSGKALGNFPQAYTHVGLLTAAMSLANAMASRGRSRQDDAMELSGDGADRGA